MVRHGVPSKDGQSIDFSNRCGLKMEQKLDCKHHPFPEVFNYMGCDVYREKFAGSAERNDVLPTSDFNYSDLVMGSGVTDLDII